MHKCSAPNCRRVQDPAGNGRCIEHLPCPGSGCTRYRDVIEGKPAKYCQDHHVCGNHLLDDPDHKCDVVIHREHKFCEQHRCTVGSCQELRFTWLDRRNELCIGREYNTRC